MPHNAFYMFFLKETIQNKMTTKKRKKFHPAGVEPQTSEVSGQRVIHCATQPLLKPYD